MQTFGYGEKCDCTFAILGNGSSCTLSMGGIKNFTVNAKISSFAVLVPDNWPAYDMISSSYSHSSGDGTSKINIDVTSSSFTFN